ncbi:MAG TPA: hypothetical protein VF773_06400 [Verrucomicrobiae bacterium]
MFFAIGFATGTIKSFSDLPPPYLIQATVTVENHQLGISARPAGTLTFVQSNGWWDVEIVLPSAKAGEAKVSTCRKISNGTQSYIRFNTENRDEISRTPAVNCVVKHPADSVLYDAWASLSARAELPVVDTKLIRRNLDLPGCFIQLVDAPENEALYKLKFLDEAKTFISFLQVTNRGFGLDTQVKGNGKLEPQIAKLRGPFLEYELEVLATTNIGSWTFPTLVETRRYGFRWSNEGTQPILIKRTQIRVERVIFPGGIARC